MKRMLHRLIALLCTLMLLTSLGSFAAAERESGVQPMGTLTISLDYTRAGTIASNQIAVWVEDASGKPVKTLYVSRFTADGGYVRRPESLPSWVKAADPASMSEAEIDAVSGATPSSGSLTYTWDGTSANGTPVSAGNYTFYVEGTLYWGSSVLYSGTVTIGGDAQPTIEGIATYTESPEVNVDMLQNVQASYAPTEATQHALGGLSPEDALAYMKRTENLVIVEVNAPEWKLGIGFVGALHIPYTEMAERCQEIPSNRPVILHCGAGIVSVEAYETLLEKRPDFPELSYIAGVPPVRQYNEWLDAQS